MDEYLYYNRLFDLYGSLLTDKQREIYMDYFFENLTQEEISVNHGISKNAVSKTIKNIKASLEEYENKLHMREYLISLEEEFKNDIEILKRIHKYDKIIS